MTGPGALWPVLPETWVVDEAVHVLRVDVPAARSRMAGLSALLSPGERVRAARFRQTADRERYVATRGVLRVVLASVLRARGVGAAPCEIRIARGTWGKPYTPDAPDVAFNVSHAGDLALVAVAHGRDVGVDVEHARPDIVVGELVAVALSDEERTWWATVSPDDRHGAFFDLWTRKEALAKAAGGGLGRTEIPWAGPERDASERDAPERVAVDGRVWTVRRLDVAPSYPAAVAAAGAGWPLRTWTYRFAAP